MAGDVGREGGMGLKEKSQEVGRDSTEDALGCRGGKA